MSRTMIAVCLSALLAATAIAAQNLNALSPQERRDGFVSLFDGVSAKGWHVLPLGNGQGMSDWIVKDGVLTYVPGDMWLASDAQYADFELRLEYRTTGANTDSGIFLRSAPAGYPSWTGMELEMKGDDAGKPPGLRTSMSVIGSAAPLKSAHKGPGEWNAVDVTLNKRQFTAIVNGEKIHDFSLDDPAYAVDKQHTPLADRVKSGFIGFQCHAGVAPAEYRNIRIRIIPS
jgi:hypothetical protein